MLPAAGCLGWGDIEVGLATFEVLLCYSVMLANVQTQAAGISPGSTALTRRDIPADVLPACQNQPFTALDSATTSSGPPMEHRDSDLLE